MHVKHERLMTIIIIPSQYGGSVNHRVDMVFGVCVVDVRAHR